MSRVLGVFFVLAAGVCCGFALLYPTGMVGVTKKPGANQFSGASGCFCHNDVDSASSRTRVWITGPGTLRAGEQALYTIAVAKESSIAAGFDISAFAGELGITDSAVMYLQAPNDTSSDELTHVEPRLANGRDTISWVFYYRAPGNVGFVDTLYATGNSANLNGSPDGDYWNFAPYFLVRITDNTVVPEHLVVQSFRVFQNYPNPFNPGTVVRFDMSVPGRVSLVVYDVTGRSVGEFVNEDLRAGTYERQIPAVGDQTLSNGVYFYRLIVHPQIGSQASPFVATRKMLLLK